MRLAWRSCIICLFAVRWEGCLVRLGLAASVCAHSVQSGCGVGLASTILEHPIVVSVVRCLPSRASFSLAVSRSGPVASSSSCLHPSPVRVESLIEGPISIAEGGGRRHSGKHGQRRQASGALCIQRRKAEKAAAGVGRIADSQDGARMVTTRSEHGQQQRGRNERDSEAHSTSTKPQARKGDGGRDGGDTAIMRKSCLQRHDAYGLERSAWRATDDRF